MSEENHLLHTLDNGFKIYLTNELKELFEDKQIKLEELWKHKVKVEEKDKDFIILGLLPKTEAICPIFIGFCAAHIRSGLKETMQGLIFEDPRVFLFLEQLIGELKKTTKLKQKLYTNLIKEVLDDYFIKQK